MKRSRTARHVLILTGLVAAAGLAVSSAAAQTQPTTPAAPAPKAQPVPGSEVNPAAPRTVILLVEFSGKVQVRRPNPAAKDGMGTWEPARAGVILPEGTQIRTGPGSSAVVQIGSTQRITVGGIQSMMSLRAAANDAGTERTRVDLEMGRLGVSVDSTRVANDVQITTPQTTLAVTGTDLVIEHTSAFGTLAAGAEGNTGSFVVFYRNGAVATVTGTQETSSSTPDPAVAREERASTDAADPQVRESDEREVAQRASGTGEALGLNYGFSAAATELITFKPITIQPPAAVTRFLGFDQGTGVVFESDITGGSRRNIVEGINVFPEAPFSGLSIIEGAGVRTLYLLRSDVDLSKADAIARNELFAMDLANPQGGFVPQSKPGNDGRTLLQGLGSLGSGLYAHGFDLGAQTAAEFVHSIYELSPTTADHRTAMAIPGVSIGGLGGSNERGSLFVGGKLDLADGSDQFVFLEIDPRTNYLINAYGGADSELVPTAGTFASAGLDPSSIDNISGLAVVDGVLVMAATANVGGRATNVVLQYDPAASNSKTSPRLRRVDAVADASFIGALASERGISPRGSRPLENPPGPIDLTTINSVFAQMSYSQEALNGDVLQRLVANEVLLTARDPAGCAASGALDALPSILRRHVDQTSGVGRSVGEFRLNLPIGHPCGAD